ncbi:MAG: hypothetical protein IJM54_04190 [Thermoguttaceae bacterium]|nr:hypothetical protein [Thermoguttaceae bacterium]
MKRDVIFATWSRLLAISLVLATVSSANAFDRTVETYVNGSEQSIVYDGDWYYQANRQNGEFRDDINASRQVGDSFEFEFIGEKIEFYGNKSADNRGKIDVYLDGVKQTTVDCADVDEDEISVLIFAADGLKNERHVLKGVHVDGIYMDVDYFKVYSRQTLPDGKVVDASQPYDVSNYDLKWNSPGVGSLDSMPLGNGDVGLNVWTETNGDLLFYIGKIDAIDGNVYDGNRNGANAKHGSAHSLKLGRVRISAEETPFRDDLEFSQQLDLKTGSIVIKSGNDGSLLNLRLWVDANNPTIRVEGFSASKLAISLETWRDETTTATLDPGLSEVVVDAPDEENRLVWYHRNVDSNWNGAVKEQGTVLSDEELDKLNPLQNLTFGCSLFGQGLVKQDARTLTSAAEKNVDVDATIVVLSKQTPTPQTWLDDLTALQRDVESASKSDAFKAHCDWWKQYWDRSYVEILGGTDLAFSITQNYILQRFVSGCSTRGTTLSHFNGSVFNVEVDGSAGRANFFGPITQNLTADYSAWAATMYMMQNTRHIYEPLCESGDFDSMKTLVKYLKTSLPVWIAKNKARYGDGSEYRGISIFENSAIGGVGGPAFRAEHLINDHLATVEIPWLALQYYRYTGDEETLIDDILPVCDAAVDFFDLAFKKDADGKMILSPSGSAETVVDATNPTPTICGLKALLEELLALNPKLTSEERRLKWRRVLESVPEIPVAEFEGKTVVDVAQNYSFETRGYRDRCETVNLYAIYPFKRLAFDSAPADLALARRTYWTRWTYLAKEQPVVTMDGTYGGWNATPLSAATLGLTRDVADMAENMSAQTCPKWKPGLQNNCRFPAFWGPYYDWVPDQDHGGNFANLLQSALLTQNGDGQIRLFNGWPENWDVRFKLRATNGRTVEAVYQNGRASYKVDGTDNVDDVCDMSSVKNRIRALVSIACADYKGAFAEKEIGVATSEKTNPVTGTWLRQFGRSVCQTVEGPYEIGDWGGSTFDPKTGTVYLHVVKDDWDGKLTLPAPDAKILECRALTGSGVEWNLDTDELRLSTPPGDVDPIDTIIEVKTDAIGKSKITLRNVSKP